MPWPLRWLVGAVVLGFSGALALWAFEVGKDIAGLDRNAEQELGQLRSEVKDLRAELLKAQSVANTSDSLLTAEKAAQEQLVLRIRELESDNQELRSDLGFFERLIPGTGTGALSIRGLQVERVAQNQIKWQVLIMQAVKNAPEFKGALEVSFTGTLDGKPWMTMQGLSPRPIVLKGYLRQEGLVDVPELAVVKTVTAKIVQDGAVKVLHTVKL